MRCPIEIDGGINMSIKAFIKSMVITAASILTASFMLMGSGNLIADYAGHWIVKNNTEYTGGSL